MSEPDAGLEMLESAASVLTVKAGEVEKCEFLPLLRL
jgi:hypothetical protein